MMQEFKLDPKIVDLVEFIKNQVWAGASALAKGGVKLDHEDVREMIMTAMVLKELQAIRNELILSNSKLRQEMFPQSMFNLNNNGESQNKGE